MEFFKIKKSINFMRYKHIFNLISLITFFIAIGMIYTRGLNLSIEFLSGTIAEIKYEDNIKIPSIRRELYKTGISKNIVIQNYGDSKTALIKFSLAEVAHSTLYDHGKLNEQKFMSILADAGYHPKLMRLEVVGPQIGKEVIWSGIMAIVSVCLGIILYLYIRFEKRFAISAIIANMHDVIIILGFFAYFRWEFSLSALTAMLAVLGYSINESVVIFDRIRETLRLDNSMSIEETINHSITSTISRTIITHLNTQLMVTSMLLFGGKVLHSFSIALSIGIICSIYSSILVSSPLLCWMKLSRLDIRPIEIIEDDKSPNAGAVL